MGYHYTVQVGLSESNTLSIAQYKLLYDINLKKKFSDDWYLLRKDSILMKVNGAFFAKIEEYKKEDNLYQINIDKDFFNLNINTLFKKL